MTIPLEKLMVSLENQGLKVSAVLNVVQTFSETVEVKGCAKSKKIPVLNVGLMLFGPGRSQYISSIKDVAGLHGSKCHCDLEPVPEWISIYNDKILHIDRIGTYYLVQKI